MRRPLIRSLTSQDWQEVRDVYLDGIATGLATFETEAPFGEQWDQGHLKECRLVACLDGLVVGWVAVSPVSGRKVYAGVVDESVYVSPKAKRLGVGRALLNALAEESERHGVWSLQAGIIRENTASIALHTSCGFREIGYQEKKGSIYGIWHDVVLMERRSQSVGQ